MEPHLARGSSEGPEPRSTSAWNRGQCRGHGNSAQAYLEVFVGPKLTPERKNVPHCIAMGSCFVGEIFATLAARPPDVSDLTKGYVVPSTFVMFDDSSKDSEPEPLQSFMLTHDAAWTRSSPRSPRVWGSRVLVVSAMMPQLGGTMASPFEAVQKLKPDRSVSEEVRVVHDQRTINYGANKFLHPPALQPTHSQIAKRILWAKGRCPGLPVLLSKNISGAFRLLWVAPEDVELFAGELPWNPRKAFPDGVEVSSLVQRQPGGMDCLAALRGGVSQSPLPALPRRDMAQGFDCKVLVDDGVLVEPRGAEAVGERGGVRARRQNAAEGQSGERGEG